MLNLDLWQEIFSTMRKNKLRTFLTGFSVAWGIFILMILLGAGNGLEQGILHNFSDAKNSVWMWGGTTSTTHEGYNTGRSIQFKNDDLDMIAQSYPSLENISGRYFLWRSNINYKNRYNDYNVQAIKPGHQITENLKLMEGRLLNNYDLDQYRKVAIIGRIIKEELFKEDNPIGEYVNISGIPFKVVGVYDDVHEDETRSLYIPLSLAQKTFIQKNQVGTITFTLGDASIAESKIIIESITRNLASKHKFDKEDKRALGSWNALEDYAETQAVFKGIKIFVGVIGIFTLIAGIVGVSNIMLIVVKERTKEFGVRKAIGATPLSIIGLVIQESLVVTSMAGYIGLIFGVGLLEVISSQMPASDFFRNPGVNFRVAIAASVLIILAGVIAGYVPARKASKIKPIVALRDE